METIRTFVAIELKVEQTLKESWQQLRNLLQSENIKWVDEHTLHLTLFFLGETEVKSVSEISNNLEIGISKVPAFKINLQGFGSFGNPANPKIIWVGITKSESIIHLQSSVSKVLTSFGFKAEFRDFSPHITVGRVKHMSNSKSLLGFIENNRSAFFQESLVDRVILYRSDLKPTGPIYTPIKEMKLLAVSRRVISFEE